MKRLIAGVITSALIGTLLLAATASAGGVVRVPVCHLNDVGGFQLIEVAEPAYDNHIAHGDGGIREAILGQPGHVFDESCQTVDLLLEITSLDATGGSHMVARWEDTDGNGVPSETDTIRTGELPQFSTATTWTYVRPGLRFDQDPYTPGDRPAFTVTSIVSLTYPDGGTSHEGGFYLRANARTQGNPDPDPRWGFRFTSRTYFDQYEEYQLSAEWDHRSEVLDLTQGPGSDMTRVCRYSPSLPDPAAALCTPYLNYDPAATDLIQYTHYGTW